MVVDPSGPFYIADYQNVSEKWFPLTGNDIQTVAGTGALRVWRRWRHRNQPGPPAVQLAHPCGIALDHNGNLYIADAGDNRIRMINPTGYISTVAGAPIQGFAGDGGLATFADLDTPESVAVDSQNNLYFADTMNNRIRKLTFFGPCSSTTGACPAVITTVASSGPSDGR